MRLSDRSKTSMVITGLLLAAAVFLIPWGRQAPPGEEYPVSTLDISALAPAPGIALTVADVQGDDALEATVENTGTDSWYYDIALVGTATLELQRAGVWYQAPLAGGTAFNAILYTLEPGGTARFSYSQAIFDPPLPAGDYRLVLRLWDQSQAAPHGPYMAQANFRVLAQ